MKLISRFEDANPTTIIRYGTVVFTVCIALAYALYPHWITLSDFVQRWYTLIPFVLAMLIAIFELWYIGSKLYHHSHLRVGAVLLYVSAGCAGLILCVPYLGSAPQKDIHDAIALCFVVFAASGFASIAKWLCNYPLGLLSGLMYGLCILEVVFLARYKEHPVYSWVWTIMELAGIATMMTALYVVAELSQVKRP